MSTIKTPASQLRLLLRRSHSLSRATEETQKSGRKESRSPRCADSLTHVSTKRKPRPGRRGFFLSECRAVSQRRPWTRFSGRPAARPIWRA
jgi:hypothetical protein